MAGTKTFSQFTLKPLPSKEDFVVGYNAEGTEEIRTSIQGIADATASSFTQTLSAPGINVPSVQMSIVGDTNLVPTQNSTNSIIQWNKLDFATDTSYLSASTANRNFVIYQPGYYRIELRYASYDIFNPNGFLRLQIRVSPNGPIGSGTGGELRGTIEQGYVGTAGNGEAMKSGILSLSATTTPLWVAATMLHAGATGGTFNNDGYPVYDNTTGTQPYMIIERVQDVTFT